MGRHLLGRHVRCKVCQTVWLPQADKAGLGDTSISMGNSGSRANDSVVGTSQLASTGDSASGIANQQSGPTTGPALENEAGWIGQKLGRFQITDVLGKGAMGVVFRAHDPDLKRDTALKILTKQFIKSQKRTYRLEQFVREARSAAQLSHPNSVTVYEIGRDKGWFFIAMELVERGTLLELVRKNRKHLTIEQICELIAQAGDALSAAHKLGIVHRDIKPSNLMIAKDGRIKVADFGLAQMTNDQNDFDLPTKAVGTPYWMSPEQCKGQTAVPQSDIYSLGAVLYFTLTGQVPFKGKKRREVLDQHLHAEVGDPRRFRKDIPETLVRVINRAMAKDPAKRFQDAGEMAIVLRQVGAKAAQAKMAEKWWGRLATEGTTGTGATQKNATSWVQIFILIFLLGAIVAGIVIWRSHAKTKTGPSEPPASVEPIRHGPPPAKTVINVPVYVLQGGGKRYHTKDCPQLKDVPANLLIEIPSEQLAKDNNLQGCIFCRKQLQKLQKEARKKAQATRNK